MLLFEMAIPYNFSNDRTRVRHINYCRVNKILALAVLVAYTSINVTQVQFVKYILVNDKGEDGAMIWVRTPNVRD